MASPVKPAIAINHMTPKEKQISILIMGALKEMLNDSEYCYVSSKPEFSHMREAGEEFMLTVIRQAVPMLAEAQAERRKDEAESLMMKKLSD